MQEAAQLQADRREARAEVQALQEELSKARVFPEDGLI